MRLMGARRDYTVRSSARPGGNDLTHDAPAITFVEVVSVGPFKDPPAQFVIGNSRLLRANIRGHEQTSQIEPSDSASSRP